MAMAKNQNHEVNKKKTSNGRREQTQKKKQKGLITKSIVLVLLLVVLVGCIVVLINQMGGKSKGQSVDNAGIEEGNQDTGKEEATVEKDTQSEESKEPTNDEILEKAKYMAAGYDYDGAIALLEGVSGYEKNSDFVAAIADFNATKATLVPVDVDKVPHIFYHSLVNNKEKVFDGDSEENGYNQVMTTIDEFDKITKQMYDKGYVFVRLRDLVKETKAEDGTVHFVRNDELMLPPDKKAVVLSVDDLSYYHYMEDDGFPQKLVKDENGKVKCLVVNDDGTKELGDFDVVPRLNTFLEEHPDGAYKGARGMIALTGYNGVLGYRTDADYRDKVSLQNNQKVWLEKNPNFDFNKEVEEAKVVADAVKESGWEFASHTWGHINVSSKSLEAIKIDHEKWKENVESIVGKTDLIIFAFGADIGDWKDYSSDNEKFNYLKSQGFNFFCNVDSSPYWVQIRDNYVRQGRRNLDGYLMYKSMTENSNLEDLFHVQDVFDSVRPTPITFG